VTTCIVVLGGHRCGTSAVAGALHHLGVFMGHRLIGPTPFNPRGHWEDVEFVELHKKIVGGWKRPCVDFVPTRKQYMALIRRREAEHKLWGFKDPRACYVFPHFLRCVKAKVKVVAVNRGMTASAKSMVKRRKAGSSINVTARQARAITRQYRDARWLSLQVYDGPILRVQFEELTKYPQAQVERLAKFIGVNWTQKAVDFINPKLRHF
jgi:hypothetical protein